MNALITKMRQLITDEEAPTFLEYALLLVVIALVVVAAAATLGTAITGLFNRVPPF